MSSEIVTTELGGRIDLDRARAWRDDLHTAITERPPGSVIRLLVDQTGYRPAGLKVHRAVRVIVPELLAAHGLAPALADLSPNTPVRVQHRPLVRIEACAMVHHDTAKMEQLDQMLGRHDQHFFGDRAAAVHWLTNLVMTGQDPTPDRRDCRA
jgi:hypothetical protein